MIDEHPMIFPLGPDGILVRFSESLSEPANRAALAFDATLRANAPFGIVETATSLTSTFLRFDPDVTSRDALIDTLKGSLAISDWYAATLPKGRKLWTLPASFGGEDGPDLAETAGLVGISEEAAIEQLCAAKLRVLALGFAPGQPYLGFLPENWDIPRQSAVTPKVPRGAVVVAVRQVIPFANPAPTGWRHIGRTSFRCYDANAKTPLPLRPGDEVRYCPVTPDALSNMEDTPLGGASVELLE